MIWKEHRIILGLQTPVGAVQSKFCLQGDAELLCLHHRTCIMIEHDFFAHLSKPQSHLPLFPPQISSPCPFLKYSPTAWMKATKERRHCGMSPGKPEEVIWDQAGEGVGNCSMEFPLPLVQIVKSLSPLLAGCCIGMRW